MTNDMTKGNIFGIIIRFTIPLVLGNVIQQLYNVVDSIIVGRFVGKEAFAAVGATGSIVFLVFGLIIGMTSGFSVLIAQSFGAQDEKGVKHFTVMSGYLGLLLTVILTLLTTVFLHWMLQLLNTPDSIYHDSYTYLFIMFSGCLVTVLFNLLSAILRALGDSKSPLIFLIIASVFNIVLDLLFILGFGMGVAGAAYATVTSQGISVICCFFYIYKKYPMLHIQKQDLAFSIHSAIKLIRIGVPMALQFSITAIGTMVVQAFLNTFGEDYIAGYTAAIKAQQILTQPFASLGAAMASFVGQNMGAGQMDRIKEGVKKSILISLCYSLAAAAILLLGGRIIVLLFIDAKETQVVEAAMTYFFAAAPIFPFLGLIYIFRNTLQGMGDGFFPMLGGVFELIARGLVAMVLVGYFGYLGICLADPTAWVSALIPLIPVYYIRMKRLYRCNS